MATASNPHALAHDPPRGFGAYDKTPHVAGRFDDDRRPITRSLAKVALRHGTVEDNPVDRPFDEWRFRHRLDGIDVVVAAGEAEDHSGDLRIFTAYLDVADARVADMSETWSKQDLHTAAMLQYLGGDRRVRHLRGVNVDVYEPVDYHGHVLVWNEGHTDPFCLACEHTTLDGDEWDRRPCYG